MHLEAIYSDNETREMINHFKEQFGICEMVYKIVLKDHQLNKTGILSERLRVDMRQVPYALNNYAGYNFDRDLLIHLFCAEERAGIRSVKKLRDVLTHNVNQKAIDELIKRENELYGYINKFLSEVRKFDE